LESETELNQHRINMMSACFLHFDCDAAAMVRWIGGPHTNAHINVPVLLDYLKPIVTNDVWTDLARILRETAVDIDGQLASFVKNKAVLMDKHKYDIAAPGVDIWSTLPMTDPCILCRAFKKYKYGMLSGTSMAVPYVSGALALLQSFAPNATAAQLWSAVMATRSEGMVVQTMAAMEHLYGGAWIVPQNKTMAVDTLDGAACPSEEQVPVRLILKTDAHPKETSFELKSSSMSKGNVYDVVWDYSNLQKGQQKYVFQACVDKSACHVLTIRDSNGLCCEFGLGGYQLFYNGREVKQGAIFQELVTVEFGVCHREGTSV